MAPRLLAIGLDGFEISLAKEMMADGRMPNLARLAARGARWDLDQADKLSGLAWEHLSMGKSPADGGRWSPVMFDTNTYNARQQGSSSRPFFADVPLRSVVVDLPYCDLASAPALRGITSWGSHDPGVPAVSRPAHLHEEIATRFGPYPAADWIYGFSWPSVRKTVAAAAALTSAVRVRADMTRWLLADRIPDWDIAMVVVGEVHSAIEPLWHGVDPKHPLHGIPSAKPAADGLRAVYDATDDLIGTLSAAFPDATLAVFTMHGMGINEGDVASMVLLPELLHRHAFGKPHMLETTWPAYLPDGTPLLPEDGIWEPALASIVPLPPPPPRSGFRGVLDRVLGNSPAPNSAPPQSAMAWMPATRYSAFWPDMPAFALPAFYDGRVRVNLQGRESRGIVPRDRYRATLEQIANLVGECHEPIGGQRVVAEVKYHSDDPMQVDASQADMTIMWKNIPVGLVHPTLGTVGPVPWRRTGGHTGVCGFLYVSGDGVASRDAGAASAYDVVPTLVALAGLQPVSAVSGRSLV